MRRSEVRSNSGLTYLFGKDYEAKAAVFAVHFAGNSHSLDGAIFGEELLEVVFASIEMNIRNVDLSFFVHGPLTILSCRRIRNLDL